MKNLILGALAIAALAGASMTSALHEHQVQSFESPSALADFQFIAQAHANTAPSPAPILVQPVPSGPDFVTKIWNWLTGPGGMALLGLLFAMSEALGAWFPNLKASAVFQLFVYGLQKIDPNLPATAKPTQS